MLIVFFSMCQKLTNINLSNYKFSNLFNVNRAFRGCTSLEKLKLPKMKQKLFAISLFGFCNELTNLDIQNKLKLRFKSDFENIMISCPLEKIKDKYIEIAEE